MKTPATILHYDLRLVVPYNQEMNVVIPGTVGMTRLQEDVTKILDQAENNIRQAIAEYRLKYRINVDIVYPSNS